MAGDPQQDKRIPLGEHIDELRRRLIRTLIAVALACIVCMSFSKPLLEFMAEPIISVMENLKYPMPRLQEIQPGEYFFSLLKVAMLAGIVLSSPFVFYEIWQFVKIGLHDHEQRFVYIFGPLLVLSFIAGTVFTYFAALPLGLHFLLKMSPEWLHSQWALAPYISMLMGLAVAMGLVFELPLVMLFVSRLGIVDSKWFASYRRPAYFMAFVLGMVLTPPDPITQLMLALPMIVLYELGIQLSKITIRQWIHKDPPEDDGERT